jgi:hypothetical protein
MSPRRHSPEPAKLEGVTADATGGSH